MSDPRNFPRDAAPPTHQRLRPAFSDLFDRDQRETILAMDEAGADIPSQAPAIPLSIQDVGVTRSSIPVAIVDPLGGGDVVQLSCEIEARVSLSSSRRGIHVSRIGDLLARLTGRVFQSLDEYVVVLSELLRAEQGSDSASVAARGILTYVEQVSGVKEKSSLEHLQLSAAAECTDNRKSLQIGFGFSHITACPCVQQTYRNSFRGNGAKLSDGIPFLTHSQRCRTEILLRDVKPLPTVPALLPCVDSVVVRSQNTLPRDHELLNVFRAHQRPQFLEDVLRDLVAAVFQLVRGSEPGGSISIHSNSMESIHDFDLSGEITYSLNELEEILGL